MSNSKERKSCTRSKINIFKRETDRIIKKAEKKYSISFGLVNIKFIDSLGVTAAKAIYHSNDKCELEFSIDALTLDWHNMYNNIIPHEVAHLVCYILYSNDYINGRLKPHGKEWKEICVALGGNGKGLIDVKLPRKRKRKEHEYVLESGNSVWIPTITHNRIQEDKYGYVVAGTKEPIFPENYNGNLRKI